MKKIYTLLFSVLILNNLAFSQAGALDSTFSNDGIVTNLILGTGYHYATSIVIQPDGKILEAGFTNVDFVVVRYNADGGLDSTFDNDGIVITDIGTNTDMARGIALQSDGKIVVAGEYHISGGIYKIALARYNTNGSLDTTFSNDGIVTTSIGTNWDEAFALAIQPDGKIVITGRTSYSGPNYNFFVVRYNTNGSLDTTFDNDGVVTTAIGNTNAEPASIAVQSDNKIVVAGSYWNGSYSDIALVRYNANGSLDSSFNNDGIVTTAIGSYSCSANSISILADGKILIGGVASGISFDFGLVKYNTDGSLDTTFGNNGIVTTDIGGSEDQSRDIVIQPDGKIVLSGFSYNGSYRVLALVRYNVDGSLDSNFDNDGKVTTVIGSENSYGISLALQNDGKIVVGGYAGDGAVNNYFILARYMPCANTFSSITATACGSYTWLENTYNNSGTFTDTIPNTAGCDSIITLTLTINTALDLTITLNDSIITANQSGATYQWLNCENNYFAISNETNQHFTANISGNYAVKITLNGCTDTSACITPYTTAIDNIESKNLFVVYPNPSNNIITVKSSTEGNYTIVSELGQTIQKLKLDNSNKYTVNIENLNSGVYFIICNRQNETIKQKIVIIK